MPEDVVIEGILMLDSWVLRVGLYLSAMLIALKVGVVFLSSVKSFLWPF